MSEPLRILILAANPVDTDELALKAEHRLLRNKMRANAKVGNCELWFEWAARLEDLKARLASYRPHVIHFAGHGSVEGICFEDDEGKSSPASKEELNELFSLFREHLRLVVLNACFSARQVEAMSQSVDYVVGTKAAVADATAVRFAAHFYEALAVGGTVREAYYKSQAELNADHKEPIDEYELLTRSGVDEATPLLPPMLPPTEEIISKNTFGRIRTPTAEFVNVSQEGPNDGLSDAGGPNKKYVQENTVDYLEATKSVSFINKRKRR
jgi:CHAT domain